MLELMVLGLTAYIVQKHVQELKRLGAEVRKLAENGSP